MISVNDIIDNALHRTGVVMDEESANANQFAAGLADLKSLLAELNTENYLLENYQTFDCYTGNKIKFAVKPDRWFEVDSVTVLDNLINEENVEVGDIFKIKGKSEFYCIQCHNGIYSKTTNQAWNDMMTQYWPTFFVDAVPDRAIGVARKIGPTYRQLFPADKMQIDAMVKQHLSTLYVCETEFEKVEYPHDPMDPNYEPYLVEYFVIEFDSIVSAHYRVTILKGLPEIKQEDIPTAKLPFSAKYEAMIEDGLCVKLCERYKYLELIDRFDTNFEAAKTKISIINDSNRPMTYDLAGRGYNDNYWNLTTGSGWC